MWPFKPNWKSEHPKRKLKGIGKLNPDKPSQPETFSCDRSFGFNILIS